MSLFDIFWKKKDTVELARKKTDVIESESYTIPSHLTAKEFGKVNIFPKENDVEVQFTVLMEPQGKEAEGWQTGVALDCSASMKDWYGKLLSGKIPPDAESAYKRRGWVETSYNDGGSCMAFRQEAYDDAIKKGYLKFTENIVQPLAREFIAYLAGNLDADGGTTVIYWACGQGNSIEVLGDFTEEQCLNLNVEGPKDIPFGSKTMLTPAVKYFVDRFTDASRGMYIFITDGRVDDLKDVKKYTTQIAREISANNCDQPY